MIQSKHGTDVQPLVSVGIPTYNRPLGLQRTLRCITQQTYRYLEILVSDNHSFGEDTENIVRNLMAVDPRIKYYKQENNKGASYNFKFLLLQSTGSYFMWAADDDEWEPEFIQTCLQGFDEQVVLVVPQMRILHRSNSRTESIALPSIYKDNSNVDNIKVFLEVPAPSMLYGLHERESLVRIYEELYFDFADCYLLIKILLNGKVVVLNEPPKPLYTAGIDNEQYQVHVVNPKRGRLLTYHPYLLKQIKLVISSSIGFRSKLSLLHKMLLATCKLFTYHERNYRNINWKNKFKFFIIENLIKFDSKLNSFFKKAKERRAKADKKERLSISRCKTKQLDKYCKHSYSQSGEDIIVKFIFDVIGIKKPTYIDVGAYHSEHLSNTALFYHDGSRGINIEPDPTLFGDLKQVRSEDVNLNIGLLDTKTEIDFYILSTPTLNTFSKHEAEKYTLDGKYTVNSVVKVSVDTISNVIEQYCKGQYPDFLSLDVEGLDFVILQSIDYEKSSPLVICVETISFSENGTGVKDMAIINFLESKGYMVYADTYINTIFVKKSEWVRS